MNSLNILSARVSTPAPSRSNSYGNLLSSATTSESRRNSRGHLALEKSQELEDHGHDIGETSNETAGETSPLLAKELGSSSETDTSRWLAGPRRLCSAFISSVRWVLSAVISPGIYLLAFLYDEEGHFAPFSYMRRDRRPLLAVNTVSSTQRGLNAGQGSKSGTLGRRGSSKISRGVLSNSSSSGMSSESESERERNSGQAAHSSGSTVTGRYTRSSSSPTSDEIAPARRSIRIKLHNEDSVRQRKHKRSQSANVHNPDDSVAGNISPAALKSPTSPSSSLMMTKYPRAPAPPRPLVPRRQPSYSIPEAPSRRLTQKTLILDLDETLIHSMAKGGRMSTGHMVEVKLNTMVGAGGSATPGPQHPILYYVHKRPHCDDFLRRVCKWYNLVIFTASVQEYADPVIDWLEQERKFFSGRYYRQHCTYRHGAFIKDLSSVEPDLSKVMILDNSPLSYMFHQDNAIPIEGWINDPTDNDLLHLVPLLEGLQYVTDVRAFLALRGGEDGKHMIA